jgi:NADPH:quinone reductase-like Zn-dependent oxidoreductase
MRATVSTKRKNTAEVKALALLHGLAAPPGKCAMRDPGAQGQADARRRGRAQAAAPQGIDVVYDPVGGTAFAEALKTINWGAQVLVIGFASGTIPKARRWGLRGRLLQGVTACA